MPRRMTSSSTRSTSPTTRWSRRATAASNTGIANIGEVLPAGGKVFTMLDISYVYMDIYLPTAEAGKIKVGTDARIVLDAYPERADPGEGVLHREPGAVHAEDGRDPERARQADVPHPRAHRSRALCARMPTSCAAACRASPTSAPIRHATGREQLQGDAVTDDEPAAPSPPRRRHAALRRASPRSTTSRSRSRPAAWSG